MINVLDGPNGPVSGNADMKKIVVDYYKDVFRCEPRHENTFRDDFYGPEKKIIEEEKVRLEARFSEEEIKHAIFDTHSDCALGPNGLPFMFSKIPGTSLK